MEYFRVRNWEKFQHYSKRRPPWIRVYRALLDEYDLGALSDSLKWQLVAIWLLASAHDNRLAWDEKWITRETKSKTRVDLKRLLDGRWIEMCSDASTTLASCKRTPPSETETETETEVQTAETEDAAADLLREQLIAAGVGEPKLSQCTAVPGLLPVHIPILLGRAKQEGRKRPVGWLIHHVLSGFNPAQVKVGPKELCDLVKAGRIISVNGVEVCGSAKWNDSGLYVNGQAIEAKEIDLSAVVMK